MAVFLEYESHDSGKVTTLNEADTPTLTVHGDLGAIPGEIQPVVNRGDKRLSFGYRHRPGAGLLVPLGVRTALAASDIDHLRVPAKSDNWHIEILAARRT